MTKAQREIGADADIFFQAVGWLARENNVNFNKVGKTMKISLFDK